MRKKFRFHAFYIPLIAVLTIPLLQFVVNSKYHFPEVQPFSGKYLYNPYKDMDPKNWKLANFHSHTRCYEGLTNGKENSEQDLEKYFRYLNFNIINISNYQSIDSYESRNKWYIPVYEHGYQYYKTHQLVLNTERVSWLDFPFRQTLSNKQSVIDHLKKDKSVLVTVVHPLMRRAYTFNDLKYLGNYDCLEIASQGHIYSSCYDTILSSGHPVFILANDDTHNVHVSGDSCHSFSFVNSSLTKDSILAAVKGGRVIGVNLNTDSGRTNEEKRAMLQDLPSVTEVNIRNDTLVVILNKQVGEIRFIGQNGLLRKKVQNTCSGHYFFSKKDTYIRTEIQYLGGTTYFLNPVFRYDGYITAGHYPTRNHLLTWAIRSVFIATLVAIVIRFILARYRSKVRIHIIPVASLGLNPESSAN